MRRPRRGLKAELIIENQGWTGGWGGPRAMERSDRAVSEAKPPRERAKHVHRIVRADPARVKADRAESRWADRARGGSISCG